MNEHKIKLVQVNMARTATANEDLLLYAQREKVDVALLQEPYVRYGRLVGLEATPIRIILAPGVRNRGGHNIFHGAAIVVFNPALTVLARDDLTCDNFAVATVSTKEGSEISLISAYFKYRDPTAGLINTLRRIKRACGNRTLIAADINAFSTDWFSGSVFTVAESRRVSVRGTSKRFLILAIKLAILASFLQIWSLTTRGRPRGASTKFRRNPVRIRQVIELLSFAYIIDAE